MADPHGDTSNGPLEVVFDWITDLAPADNTVTPAPASGRAQRAHVLALVGAEPLEWAIELGHRVAEQITREISVAARNDDGFEKLRTGTESTALRLLAVLAGDELDGAATPESLAAVTGFVQRHMSLDEVLRSIQLGHGVMASAFLAECGSLSDRNETLVQMRALSEKMFRFFDVFATEMAAHYRVEKQRWEGSDTSVKLGVVTALLKGSVSDAVAERKLGYPLTGSHVALVAVGPELEEELLAAAIGGVLAAARSTHRIVLVVGPGVVWAWGAAADADHVAAAINVSSLPPGTHAVAGAVATGSVGFRQSHREAAAAAALLRSMPSTERVMPYGDVDLLSLLLADPYRARAFMTRELGQLAAETSQARDLRRTVAAFIDERGSPYAAAQRLNVSRNTVSYRVQRAEEMLGRSVNVRRLQLRCALLIQEISDTTDPDEQRPSHIR